MPNLELKVPPVLVFLLVALLMYLARGWTPGLAVNLVYPLATALLLAAGGCVIAVAGIASFAKAKTTVHPQKPAEASALVTSGVYRLTRNPMYAGLLMLLIAWAYYLANLSGFIIAAGFVWYMNRFQIQPEERALKKLFGDDYSAYRAKVRRWL